MHLWLFVLASMAQPGLPPARDVVADAIAVVFRSREAMERHDVTYRKRVDIYDTSVDPPRLKETAVWLMWYRDGVSYQRLVEKDGKRVTNAETEETGPDAFAELTDLFVYTWNTTPIQEVESAAYYAIDLAPRTDRDEPDDPRERTLARMTGTMYVTVDGGYIKGLTAYLPESFRYKLFGKVNRATFLFSQRETALSMPFTLIKPVVFDEIVVDYSYAVFGIQTDERRIFLYSGYDDFETIPPAQ